MQMIRAELNGVKQTQSYVHLSHTNPDLAGQHPVGHLLMHSYQGVVVGSASDARGAATCL